MTRTSDNDKKAKDNNAKNFEKNMQYQKNAQSGKHDESKKPHHL
ncbi:hypothetical protein ACFDTO_22250 [Microbacteriaceae bacterium 4G12]